MIMNRELHRRFHDQHRHHLRDALPRLRRRHAAVPPRAGGLSAHLPLVPEEHHQGLCQPATVGRARRRCGGGPALHRLRSPLELGQSPESGPRGLFATALRQGQQRGPRRPAVGFDGQADGPRLSRKSPWGALSCVFCSPLWRLPSPRRCSPPPPAGTGSPRSIRAAWARPGCSPAPIFAPTRR